MSYRERLERIIEDMQILHMEVGGCFLKREDLMNTEIKDYYERMIPNVYRKDGYIINKLEERKWQKNLQ